MSALVPPLPQFLGSLFPVPGCPHRPPADQGNSAPRLRPVEGHSPIDVLTFRCGGSALRLPDYFSFLLPRFYRHRLPVLAPPFHVLSPCRLAPEIIIHRRSGTLRRVHCVPSFLPLSGVLPAASISSGSSILPRHRHRPSKVVFRLPSLLLCLLARAFAFGLRMPFWLSHRLWSSHPRPTDASHCNAFSCS